MLTAFCHNRTVIINTLNSLKKGLVTYFKNNEKGTQYFIDNEMQIKERISSITHALPLCAVDRWGYKGEEAEVKLDTKNSELVEQNLSHQKFDILLKTRRDYFSSSQNFINQSFSAIVDTICKIKDPEYKIKDTNFNNVTEFNLFESAYSLLRLQVHFEKYFKKFTKAHELKQLSKKEADSMIELMSIWKEFLHSPYRISRQSSRKANLTFELTKNQLLQKIYGEIIKAGKQTGHVITVNTDLDEKRLIFIIETSADLYIESISTCVNVAINVFSEMHHSSLKNLLTKLNFDTISIIPLFQSHPINNKYLELPLFKIDRVKELLFSESNDINIFEIFQFPSDINKSTLNKEGLIPWNSRIEELMNYEKIMGVASGMKLLCQQYYKLLEELGTVDEMGIDLLTKYKVKIVEHFHQIIIENNSAISSSMLESPLDNNIKESIHKIKNHIISLFDNKLCDFDMDLIFECSDVLQEKYLNFSEMMITKYLRN